MRNSLETSSLRILIIDSIYQYIRRSEESEDFYEFDEVESKSRKYGKSAASSARESRVQQWRCKHVCKNASRTL